MDCLNRKPKKKQNLDPPPQIPLPPPLPKLPSTNKSSVALCPSSLRGRVVRGAWVVLGYLEWRVFPVVTSFPWCLLDDGPAAAVDALLNMPEPPAEQLSAKAWKLSRIAYPRQQVEPAFVGP